MATKETDSTTSNGGQGERNTITKAELEEKMQGVGLYIKLERSPGEITIARVETCPSCHVHWFVLDGQIKRLL